MAVAQASPHLLGLDADVSKFFIYFLFIYTTTFCVTSLYRMFAALSPTIDDAVTGSNGATIPEMDHLVQRGVYVDNPAGFRQPRPPWLMSHAKAAPIRPAPPTTSRRAPAR